MSTNKFFFVFCHTLCIRCPFVPVQEVEITRFATHSLSTGGLKSEFDPSAPPYTLVKASVLHCCLCDYPRERLCHFASIFINISPTSVSGRAREVMSARTLGHMFVVERSLWTFSVPACVKSMPNQEMIHLHALLVLCDSVLLYTSKPVLMSSLVRGVAASMQPVPVFP